MIQISAKLGMPMQPLTVAERRAHAEEQRRRAFEQWQQSECQQYGLTVEEHNQVLEVADKLQRAAVWGDAYSAVISVVQPPLRLSEIDVNLLGSNCGAASE